MKTSQLPIGVFDSGVGGLTVARAIQTQLPYESVVYFGDRARCPYGDQAPADVLRYAVEITQFLLEHPVKCIVIACNTATAVALPTLKSMFDVPIIGVIKPGAQAAIEASHNGNIGVIGTSVTIESHAYQAAIHEIAPDAKVIEQACPAFVPLVERGLFEGQLVEQTVRDSLDSFQGSDVDTLVLGCTHYPMLSNVIRRVMGPAVRVISSADATAAGVRDMLKFLDMEGQRGTASDHRYYTTGDEATLRLALANWFGTKVTSDSVRHVALPFPLHPVVNRAVVR
ncbi:glutamate racemase [Alicyclobacillus dauci]|uniref:Glutamate racemase n=1 Tax=Alicyclobacillus dauci TaxID=1475485 RepID=A0ABY6Z8A6_9BACL|nr:glutamate racemase [Alicyclobacillus dauci]WAH38938.1 glutamate racemase [Alicyclobacillus dauci]